MCKLFRKHIFSFEIKWAKMLYMVWNHGIGVQFPSQVTTGQLEHTEQLYLAITQKVSFIILYIFYSQYVTEIQIQQNIKMNVGVGLKRTVTIATTFCIQ